MVVWERNTIEQIEGSGHGINLYLRSKRPFMYNQVSYSKKKLTRDLPERVYNSLADAGVGGKCAALAAQLHVVVIAKPGQKEQNKTNM